MAEKFEIALESGETLKGWHWAAKEPVANLTMITGMEEHAFRYDGFAKFMNEKGINVWCLDAFGQGLNSKSVEEQMQWPENGFEKNVDGIALMVKKAKENGLPTTHFGHSMGSFMTQSFLERYPDVAEKAILCGSNGGQKALMGIGSFVANLVVSKKNWDKPVPLLDHLGLGGYSKAIQERKTDLDWLSYDEENVQTYIADPYCGHQATGGFWKGFLHGVAGIWKGKALKGISKQTRVLIIAGEEDPVGQNGKGPKWLEATYKKLGLKEVNLILYPKMRHEIHNEKDKAVVWNDIASFVLKA